MQFHPERLCHGLAHRIFRKRRVQRDVTSGQAVPKPPEHDIGVSVGRHFVSVGIASRAGLRPCRLRSVAQRSAFVPPGQRPATGPDGKHFDAGKADRIAVFDIPILGDCGFTLIGQRNIGAGPSHVEPDGVFVTAQIADKATCDRSRSDTRPRQTCGKVLDAGWRHDAASGMQQQKIAPISALGQLVAKP